MYNFEHSVILWILGVVLGGFFIAKYALDFLDVLLDKLEEDDENR